MQTISRSYFSIVRLRSQDVDEEQIVLRAQLMLIGEIKYFMKVLFYICILIRVLIIVPVNSLTKNFYLKKHVII